MRFGLPALHHRYSKLQYLCLHLHPSCSHPRHAYVYMYTRTQHAQHARTYNTNMGLATVMLGLLGALLLLLSGEAGVEEDWDRFENFNARFSKKHSSVNEKKYRFRVFQESLVRQKMLNDFEAAHGGSAIYGVTKFSDLTPEEFKSLYLSGLTASPKGSHKVTESKSMNRHGVRGDPGTFDWRDKGVIGAIRNQERCGSCWAFAVVETIESGFAIENNSRLWLTLSSQQLISCDFDPSEALDGCKGGNIFEAFNTVQTEAMTLVEESAYPFVSENGETYACVTNLPKTGLRLKDFDYKDKMNETIMKSWLLSYSPLTTSINAVSWQDYIGGIIQHHCTSKSIDHAVQVVGYNMTGDVPYWIVRNTWGADWGENGYIRIKFGENMCGIADEVATVTSVVRVP